MSRIDDLIAELCPDGVKFETLNSLIDYQQPTKYLVESTDYEDHYDTPVLTAGQTFILGYTNETDGIYNATSESPVIIFDDFTTAFKWVDFPFKAKSSAMKMLTAKDESRDTLRFTWHYMQTITYEPQDHARQWISRYSGFRIPVPPLEIQREIVATLDRFTKLEAELEARRIQYTHYRDSLLSSSTSTQWTTLGEMSDNLDSQRRPVTKADREPGAIPYYGASGIVDYVSKHIFNGSYLLVSEDGANLLARVTPIAFPISGKTWVNNHAHVLSFEDQVTQKYVEIYLNSIDLTPYISGASQPKLNKANLNRIPIPKLSLADKERVVSVLTKFDALTNDLSIGLPAELAARRKQYEYYRDKLLTFKELQP